MMNNRARVITGIDGFSLVVAPPPLEKLIHVRGRRIVIEKLVEAVIPGLAVKKIL